MRKPVVLVETSLRHFRAYGAKLQGSLAIFEYIFDIGSRFLDFRAATRVILIDKIHDSACI